MDQGRLIRHIALAEERVAGTECRITRQRQLICQLQHYRQDASQALEFLRILEERLAAHLDARERLLKLLANTP